MGERARDRIRTTTVLVAVAKALFWCIAIAIPLLGMWVSSSLAVYHLRSVRVAIGVGLLAFPALPLAWEAIGEWRRLNSLRRRPHILTLGDRLLLRTFAINALFLGVMLASRPQEAFAAVATRGDWFLEDESHAASAEHARTVLFAIAHGLEWLYTAAHQNPFRKWNDEKQPEPRPEETPQPEAKPVAPQAVATERTAWPWTPHLHAAVRSMPASAETSFADVAHYLRDREHDPKQLAKAVHDWVADRIAYDADAYATRTFPPQDPETVFRTRKGVCAGYSLLFEAIAKEAGLDAAYVTGDARATGWDEKGEGHAWNAVRIDGRWQLVDATWDAGSVDGRTFKKGYRTAYFFTPPDAFVVNHFPDDDKWQLVPRPLSRGDFLRSPIREPDFFAMGLDLLAPDRAQVTVFEGVDVVVQTPQDVWLSAMQRPRSAQQFDESGRCIVHRGPETRIRCNFPARGRYVVDLFASRTEYGTYGSVAELAVNAE